MGDLPTTWPTRELPILRSALQRIDATGGLAELTDVADDTGIPPLELLAGVRALLAADPPYIEGEPGNGWSSTRVGGGYIDMVSERGRRELGTWPSADLVLQQLVNALSKAAEDEPREEEKGKLRAAAEVLAGMARDVAVGAITARLGPYVP